MLPWRLQRGALVPSLMRPLKSLASVPQHWQTIEFDEADQDASSNYYTFLHGLSTNIMQDIKILYIATVLRFFFSG